MKNQIKILLVMMIALPLVVTAAKAELVLDRVQFDPPIITSGDEVDIIVQYRDRPTFDDDDKTAQEGWEFRVELMHDDTISEEYVTIMDSEGDAPRGEVLTGEKYYRVFRVKVSPDAPAGTYEMKLRGQWYKDGEAENSYEERKIRMDVKKEGIILNIAQLRTEPAEVRPGDNYVNIVSRIENAGEKSAKAIEINLDLPNDITSSYTDNNRQYIGVLGPGESKEINFFIDVDDYAESQVYDIDYEFEYMDMDNNEYSKEVSMPFYVKPRPYLEVVKTEGSGLAGETSKLHVYLKNTGTESAESVDVRVIKQNSQPFNFDVRSDYIGELEPGEEGHAIIPVEVSSYAELKEHSFKLLIRSKGDSDEGDDNIYTYNRRAQFEVTGKQPDYTLTIGIAIAALIILYLIIKAATGRKTKKNKQGVKQKQ